MFAQICVIKAQPFHSGDILPLLVGPGPVVVSPWPSAAGRAPWPPSPSARVQRGDSLDLTHCAAALHTPVLPQIGSGSPVDIKAKMLTDQISVHSEESQPVATSRLFICNM